MRVVRDYLECDVAAAARTLEKLEPEEAAAVLKALPAGATDDVFQHMTGLRTGSILENLPEAHIRRVVAKLEPAKLATIFLTIDEARRQTILEQLAPKKQEEIREILTYPEGSAGRIMSTDFLAFPAKMAVGEAVEKIRQVIKRNSPASYTYVIDEKDKLVGVVQMRDMLLAKRDDTLESVMRRNVFSINSFMDGEDVAHELATRRYFAVPVVDGEDRLLGVIRSHQLIGQVEADATEDIQKMFGAGGEERVFSPLRFSVSKRLPWLHINLLTTFIAASVVSLFDDLIARITILAVFLPVVAGQGGNAGAQSLAVVMRGLVMREILPERVRRLIMKEIMLGAMNGAVIGVVTAVVAWLWNGNPYFGLVIGLAMVVNLVIAGFAGASIPLAMKRMGFDPAQSSTIVLTTVTDVVGFFAFLGFAAIFQDYLV